MSINFIHDESMEMGNVVLSLLKVLLSKMDQNPTTPYGFNVSYTRFAHKAVLNIRNADNNACVNVTTMWDDSDVYEITYGDYDDFDQISLTSKKTAKTALFNITEIFRMTQFIRDWLTRNLFEDPTLNPDHYRR